MMGYGPLLVHKLIKEQLVANDAEAQLIKAKILERVRTDVCFESRDMFVSFVGDFEAVVGTYKHEVAALSQTAFVKEQFMDAWSRSLARELTVYLNTLPTWPQNREARLQMQDFQPVDGDDQTH